MKIAVFLVGRLPKASGAVQPEQERQEGSTLSAQGTAAPQGSRGPDQTAGLPQPSGREMMVLVSPCPCAQASYKDCF